MLADFFVSLSPTKFDIKDLQPNSGPLTYPLTVSRVDIYIRFNSQIRRFMSSVVGFLRPINTLWVLQPLQGPQKWQAQSVA